MKRRALLVLLFARGHRATHRRESAALVATPARGGPAPRPRGVFAAGVVPATQPTRALQLGVDVLAAENFARLRGARVAVLSNDTARPSNADRSLDALAAAPAVSLVDAPRDDAR